MTSKGKGKKVGGGHLPNRSTKSKPGRSRTSGAKKSAKGLKNPSRSAMRKGAAKKRRRNYTLYYASVGTIVLSIAVILSLTVLFKVTEIKIIGSTRYSNEEVVSVSGLKTGENLFLSDTKGAALKICRDLPYVESVKITRRLSAGIDIKITEAVPAAVFKTQESNLILSSKGKVLEKLKGDIPESMPLVTGISLTSPEIGAQAAYTHDDFRRRFEEVVTALAKYNISVRAIDFTKVTNIKLNYQERLIIELGYPDEVDIKIKMAKYFLENEFSQTDKGRLILSQPNNAVFSPDTGDGSMDYKINP